MKTFLWIDMEYEFLAVNAETLEQAIEIGKAEIEAAYEVRLAKDIEAAYQVRIAEDIEAAYEVRLAEDIELDRKELYDQTTAIEKRCRKEADIRLLHFKDTPIVLEIGQAKIIYHANE